METEEELLTQVAIDGRRESLPQFEEAFFSN